MQSRAVSLVIFFCSFLSIAADNPDREEHQSETNPTAASPATDGSDAQRRAGSAAGPNVPDTPEAEDEYVISSDVELVLLDVAVKNSRGGFAPGLTREHFKVFENGHEQAIRVFAAEDAAVSLGLVIDHSGSVRPKRAEVITASLTLARRSNPEDEMFLVNFSDRVWLGLPEGTDFTNDVQLLRASMLSAPMAGRTSLYDALKKAIEHVGRGHRDKKTLVLISDGGDNSSETTREEIFRLAEESLVTVYTVGIFGPSERDKNPGFLKKLASLTGGEAFMPDDISELKDICEKIAHDMRNRYTIGYVPHDRDFSGAVRRIKVSASAEGWGRLKVRTRTHYVAAKRDAPAAHKHRHR